MRILVAALLVAVTATVHGAAADVQALMAEGKLQQALARVDADLARDGSDVTLQFLRGLVLTRLNRLDSAATVFQRITEEHPELPEPYNNLAVVHAARGDFDAAQQALQKAINTHPSYATAHENLGDIYARMASEAYNHALQLDQGNSSAKTKLALINDLFPAPSTAATPAAQGKAPVIAGSSPPRATTPPAGTPAGTPTAAAEVAPGVTELAPSMPPSTATAATTTEAAPAVEQAPAAMPAPEPVPAPVDHSVDVRRAVDAWAAAWSARDVEAYLSAYGAEFTPPAGLDRVQWEAQRRARVRAPSYIKVDLSDVRITPHGADHAQVSFDQRYESDAFTDTVRKTLILKKTDHDWKIVEEALR